ncbi:zinc-binding dehydrogenase [Nocardia sp. BMG111209]|uniref:zinc-dependent alcohol dehydrogenase n=1 Tax=Nocardia sp. BMG111209 TaxID=1160137 RepID=UPI000381DE30|nr:alcohol dehydrogenase catalytic domain-containing protein [Nocardia sp. BMG111209]
MKAAITTADQGFELVDLPDPTPGVGELVIRVAACGVCGSDIKARPFVPAGRIMGHELGGRIVAVGPQAGDRQVGVNVAVLPVVSCGTCRYCRAGVVTHCARSGYLGMGPPGGFAEFAVVPARHAFVVPYSVPDSHAALVEPFAVGLHAVHSAEVTAGEDILVVGAGGVGLTTIAWLAQRRAQRVTAVDPDPDRRALALAMGATDALPALSEIEAGAYDVAVECVGHPGLLRECQPAMRPRGRIVISGACATPTPIEPVTALLNELTIRYSVCYRPDEFRSVIRAFTEGVIDPQPMIGPLLDLSRLAEAFDLVRGGRVHGRVLVGPR